MITFCIPSKNNLRYLKHTIPNIKKNSFYENEILVFVDQDNDGTEAWLKENNISYILNTETECKGIGYAYDIMFKEAKTDLVMAFHADMFLGLHADKHMVDLHKPKSLVCATCVEPPGLHPPGIDKVICDFGLWPEEFDSDSFNTYIASISKNETTNTMFAPWLINKNEHIGHDPVFRSVFEDTDLFRRFKLGGYQLIQSWKSYVYHLTCRGGQFEHASKTHHLNTKSEQWKIKSDISFKEYIRKWGGIPKTDNMLEPVPNKKYDIGFIIKNCDVNILNFLEPWCSNIYLMDDIASDIIRAYIRTEQPYTSFNLKTRVLDYGFDFNVKSNDILVEFDAKKLTQESYNILTQLADIIFESGEVGEFELDIFKITIKTIITYESFFIHINSDVKI